MHRFANNVFRTIIGDVNAFFGTIEPDSYIQLVLPLMWSAQGQSTV
jgi:hypothetical protein